MAPKIDPADLLAQRLGLTKRRWSTSKTRNAHLVRYNKDEENRSLRERNNRLYDVQDLFHLGVTNEPDHVNARFVSFKGMRKVFTSASCLEARTITRIPNQETRIYEQSITALPPGYNGKLFEAPGVKVYCSCDRFKYKWDFALYDVGASDGLACDQVRSDITNPGLKIAVCIAKGTLIDTDKGLIPIEKVTTSHKVWTSYGYHKVSDHALTKVKAKVLKIKTSSGRELSCTPEHKILVFCDEGYIWKQAKNLKINDCLCITHGNLGEEVKTRKFNKKDWYGTEVYGTKKERVKLNKDLAELLGLMVSEGCSKDFHNYDKKLLHRCQYLADKIFGKGCCDTIESAVRLRCNVSLLVRLGYKIGSYNKKVPNWILRSKKSVKMAFLRGCYEGDGNFRKSHFTYATVSKRLAYEMFHLFHSLGHKVKLETGISGVNDSLIYYLRLSNSVETRNLFKDMKPIKKPSKPLSNIRKDISIKDYVDVNLKGLLLNEFTKKYKFSFKDKDVFLSDGMPKEILKIGGKKIGFGLFKRLGGKFLPCRLRKGGKPHSYTTLNYMIKILHSSLCEAVFNRLKGRSYSLYYGIRIEDLRARLKAVEEKVGPIEKLDRLHNEKIYYEKVKSITKGKRTDVYDITVPGVEEYTANGVVVHNCKHLVRTLSIILSRGL